MQQPSPTEVREAIQAFADSMKAGWKVYEHNDQVYAGRRFEYPGGKQALLWVKPFQFTSNPKAYLTDDAVDLVRQWEAGVALPFSAGPEVSTIGRRANVEEWSGGQEQTLFLPFKLQECKTLEAAEAMAAGFSANALVLLAAVFDIDYYQGRTQLVRELVRACGPRRTQ